MIHLIATFATFTAYIIYTAALCGSAVRWLATIASLIKHGFIDLAHEVFVTGFANEVIRYQLYGLLAATVIVTIAMLLLQATGKAESID